MSHYQTPVPLAMVNDPVKLKYRRRLLTLDRSEKVHPYAKRLVIFGYVIAAAGIILGPLYIDTEGKDNVFTTWQNIAYKRIHAFFTPTETDIQGKFLVSPDAGLELIYRKQLTKKHVDRLLDIQKASE